MLMPELQPLHISALVSIAIFLAAVLVAVGVRNRETIRRRAGAGSVTDLGGQSHNRSLDAEAENQALRLITRAGKLLAPSEQAILSAVRSQLVQAGYFSAAAIPLFYASRILLALALPLLFISCGSLLPFELPGFLTIAVAACLVVLGLIVPAVFVDRRRGTMRMRYRNAFPDFMDMIVVCIEAGQSLQGAIERVSREIVQYSPKLGANLHLVNLELRAGRSLPEALEGLANRLGIEEVQSLRLLLKQSEELGVSIATSLRVFSDEMRDKRLMRAETKAHALPVKMTLPLGLFIFPVILLVIMLPVVIRIKNAFV